jgi:hypothetical protein
VQVTAGAGHRGYRSLRSEKLAQFGDRVGGRLGLVHVAGGGLLIVPYGLILRLWCRDCLRVMLLLIRAIPNRLFGCRFQVLCLGAVGAGAG